jgi:hypothetical protein
VARTQKSQSAVFPGTTPLFDDSFEARLRRASSVERSIITRAVWPTRTPIGTTDEAAISSALFRYLMDEVDTVRRYRDLFAESTLDTAANGICILQETQSQPLTDVIHRLKQNFGAVEDDAIQRFVERCARLWLTLNIKSSAIAVGGTYHLESSLDWQSHQSIGQVAASIFVKMPRNRTLERPSKMDRAFTAQYLVDSCGLKLAWTDYLNEHLSMNTHRRLLLVYRHKAYLNSQVRYGATSLIPKDILMETLDTLNCCFRSAIYQRGLC